VRRSLSVKHKHFGTGLSPRPPVGRSVCLSVRKVYYGKMAEWIQMVFGMVSGVGRGLGVLDGGGYCRRGRGSLGGEFGAFH